MSDTSLVFNLVARDRASATLEKFKERVNTAAAGIGAGVASALGVGVAANLDMEAASDKLAAQLGVGPAEAAELSKVSASVYANAWGDSTETVNEAIKGVYQNIGDTSTADGGLEGITTKALALSETFDQEVGPTTAAVGQMLKTGLAKNADEAFDILTRGFQTGANKADDLLDTVNEYGTQWRKFGLDGQTAMGLLSQGLKAGARDADVVADSIKEFSIRAIDGSKTTAAGFKAIGLDAETMAAKIAKGGDSATSALDLTLDRLRGIKDPVKRSATAVQLFGTQAEDLGDALYALDPSSAVSALGQVGGAADKMAKTVSDNPKAALETFKRQAVTKLAEVGGTFIKFAMDHQTVMQPLAITLGGIAAAVLVIRGAMMAWTAAQAAWTAVTTIATGVQWAYNAALAANPIGLIILAIVALVAAVVVLWKKNEAFRNFVTAAWNIIWGAIKKVWDWVKKNWPLVLGILTGPIGLAVGVIVNYWDTIVTTVKGIPGKIAKIASGMWDPVWQNFKNMLNTIIWGWNNLSLTIGGGSIMGIDIPSITLSTPNIPYLAKGGIVQSAGTAIVGERGPELLSLTRGAQVTPLSRAGGAQGGETRIVFELRGGSRAFREFFQESVRVTAGGSIIKFAEG